MHGPGDLVVDLGPRTPALVDLGGKGAALARLVHDGRPVPATAVVTTSAYRRLLADHDLAATLTEVASSQVPPDPDAVDSAFLAAHVPEDVVAAITSSARRLGPQVAVRSSASAEDLADRSFAGQYRSFLEVPTEPEALLRAVRLVWASLWHPAPWAYRRAWGIPDDDVAMAVVLMAMVPADTAGVVFTRDPGGDEGAMRVEAVDGLGESLVSGQRTPRSWMVPRDRHQPLPDGAPAMLDELRTLALDLEAADGRALDLEWAHDGTTTWVVQSRPITVHAAEGDGFDTAADDHELTTAGIAEMLPGVLPPLRWELNALLVEEALRTTFHHLGADLPPVTTRFLRRVRGRAALDLDVLKEVATTIPGGTAEEIERQYFGTRVEDPPEGPRPRRRRAGSLLRDVRVARTRRHALCDAAIVVAATAQVLDDVPDLGDRDDGDLLAYRLRLVDLSTRAMAAELAVAAIAGTAFAQLEAVLAGHLGPEAAATWAMSLTTGADLAPPPAPQASRSVFAGPSWAETGGAPPAAASSDGAERQRSAHRALAGELASDPRWRRRRILTGQVVDVRLHLLRRLAADAVDDLGIRERTKAAVLALGGEVRRVHLELGRRLVARGALRAAEDLELLTGPELRHALAGRPPGTAVLGRRRRWLERWEQEPPLPERFTGVPTEVAPVPGGPRLDGRAASPGRVTGRARVVRSPTEHFDEGDVLVATATDAGWSPLFLLASAIVVERGGPLSHAAIVARELGLPAVLDVAGATARLDGATVTVDGTAGVVVVHDEVPA